MLRKKIIMDFDWSEMKSFSNFLIIGLLIALSMLSYKAYGAEILIWDNDNESPIEDPEGAGYVGCEYAIQQALIANGEEYTTLSYLPMDLSAYDLIFIILGHWCPS